MYNYEILLIRHSRDLNKAILNENQKPYSKYHALSCVHKQNTGLIKESEGLFLTVK